MLVFLSMAFADALMISETTCPKGSRIVQSHSYEYCGPAACDWCEDGTCESTGLCIETVEKSCQSGRVMNEPPCSFEASVVVGNCPDGSCATGVCEVQKVCVKSVLKTAVQEVSNKVEKTGGCGGKSPSAVGSLLLVLAGYRRSTAQDGRPA